LTEGVTPAAHSFTVAGMSQHRKPRVSEAEQAILKEVSDSTS
jgi:hypothetical protein